MMNFCPKCGTEVKPGARFCPNCGFNLQGGTTSAVGSNQAVPQSSAVIPNSRMAADGSTDYQSNLGFMGAMEQFFENYVNFNGRMSRANYWWAYLGTFLMDLVALLLSYAIGNNLPSYLLNLAILLPSLTSLGRRLHDSHHSLANILWALIPIVGGIYVLILLCKAGDQEANQFG